jgi:lysophospholipase L1-like esterase
MEVIMKNARKTFCVLILTICFVLAVASCSRSTVEPYIYVALGDSVSSGYGLSDLSQGHTALFFEMIRNEGVADEYINWAENGMTTTMLLEFLNNLSRNDMTSMWYASVVTLNIGGNNILTPFIEYISDLQIVSGAGNVRTGAGRILSGAWGVLYEIIVGIESVVSDTDESNFNVGGVVRGIGDMLTGFGRLIIGAGEVIVGTPGAVATWRGSLSPELEAMFDKGVNTFEREFNDIIEWLEINAPNATILVNTIYNPIPQDILLISVPISTWANELIETMNDVIIAESRNNRFLVTDLYSRFTNQADLMNVNLNPFEGSLSLDIIHPNARGHSLIAQMNYDTFIQQSKNIVERMR